MNFSVVFKSPLAQLVKKILKRSFHFLGESVELRTRKSVSFPLHRFVQTPGREEFSSESFHLNRLCDHERSTWWEHRPLKNRGCLRKRSSAGDQKFPVSKHRRATSNCALDFPSWQVVVLASSLENKWKSDLRRFLSIFQWFLTKFLASSDKILYTKFPRQIPEIRIFFVILTENWFLNDFLLFSQRTHQYCNLPARENKPVTGSAPTVVQKLEISSLCCPSCSVLSLDSRGPCPSLGAGWWCHRLFFPNFSLETPSLPAVRVALQSRSSTLL